MIGRPVSPHELPAASVMVSAASVAEVAAEIGSPSDAVAITVAIGAVYARWPDLPWSVFMEGLRAAIGEVA